MNELIAELVLPHLEPRYLVPCRRVSRSWSSLASRLLHRTDIHLRLTVGKGLRYLELVRATHAPGDDAEETQKNGLQTCLDSNCLANAPIDDLFIKLSKRSSLHVSGLYLRIDDRITGQDILNLITVNRDTLRELSLAVYQNPTENPEQNNLEELDNLPWLKSLVVHFVYDHDSTKKTKLIRSIIRAAINVEKLDVSPVMGHGTLASLFVDHFGTIQELWVWVNGVNHLSIMEELLFTRLRRLQILATDGVSLLPSCTRFVVANCPGLVKLEFDDTSSPWLPMSDDEDVESVENCYVDRAPKVSASLVYFKCAFSYHGMPHVKMFISQMQDDARLLLETVSRFENLSRISFNWYVCIALEELFSSMGGTMVPNSGLPDVFLNAKRPTVTMLDVRIGEELFMDCMDTHFLANMSFIFQSTFPNLEMVLVSLGYQYSRIMIAPNILGPLLDLVLPLRTVKKLELENIFMEWEWDETAENSFVHCRQNSALESLTLRDVRNRDFEYVPSKPKVNLLRLMAMLPSTRPISIHIDASMVLNTGDKKTYQEWDEQPEKSTFLRFYPLLSTGLDKSRAIRLKVVSWLFTDSGSVIKWTASCTRFPQNWIRGNTRSMRNGIEIQNAGSSVRLQWTHPELPELKKFRPAPHSRTCKGGLNLLLKDLGLLSVLTTTASLKLHTLALAMAKFLTWTVHVPTVFLKRLPSIFRDGLALIGVETRRPEPLERIMTLIFLADNLFNVLVVVPTQITVDAITLVGLVLGYVGLELDKTASYPQKFTRTVREFGLEKLIDETYGCGKLTPDQVVELVLNKLFGGNEE